MPQIVVYYLVAKWESLCTNTFPQRLHFNVAVMSLLIALVLISNINA